MRRFHLFWLNYSPFILSSILLFCCPADFFAQTRDRPTHQPKPTIRVLTLGHEFHGKSTLTAAITKVLYKTGGAKFVPYDDIENPPEVEVQGIKVAAAQVEYATDKARYIHIDCRSHSDYTKLLTSSGVALDGAILVVSAQDGPMPQTREHILMASKKGIKSIVVYMNKVDLIGDAELLDLVELEVRELLTRYGFNGKEVPVIRGSSLMALVGTRNDIGESTVIELLRAMDKHFAENKTERQR
jgi:elongation factor Tu